MQKWVLLTYKIPPKPSARRVYVWRKLKRLGALLYQDSCWVLPANSHTREQLLWLSAEIIEMGAEATLWEANALLGTTDETLAQKFIDLVEQSYLDILEQIKKGQIELETLSRQYQQIFSKDYFRCEAGKRVREALLAARGTES